MKKTVALIWIFISAGMAFGQTQTGGYKLSSIYDIENYTRKHSEGLFAYHDGLPDKTVIRTFPVILDLDGNKEFLTQSQIFASCFTWGMAFNQPPKYYSLKIHTKSQNPIMVENEELYFVVENKRIKTEKAKYHLETVFLEGVTEDLEYYLDAEDFRQISTAKLVEFRLGKYEGRLSETAINRFSSLYNFMK
jgi:hypothetical protein